MKKWHAALSGWSDCVWETKRFFWGWKKKIVKKWLLYGVERRKTCTIYDSGWDKNVEMNVWPYTKRQI